MKSKKLIVGNWKMYPPTIKEARKIFDDFKAEKYATKGTTTVICPPHVFLADLKSRYTGQSIFFGAQNIFWKEEGANTGETSAAMIKSIGARFVIIGHSERRARGVNNEQIGLKLKIALKSDLHTIFAFGEPDRDDHGNYLKYLTEQMEESMHGLTRNHVKKLIVAYEPIWAIGKGKKAMTPEELHRTALFIRKNLVKRFGRKIGEEIPILYGGSVNGDNAAQIIYEGQVDGLLVGRASLNAHEFGKIINNVSKGS